jgi:hypothetical protein
VAVDAAAIWPIGWKALKAHRPFLSDVCTTGNPGDSAPTLATPAGVVSKSFTALTLPVKSPTRHVRLLIIIRLTDKNFIY